MTEKMLLTAEEIIKFIETEIKWARADIDEHRVQIATMFDLSSPMNNMTYNRLIRELEAQRYRHNEILTMRGIINLIEAAEEDKRYEYGGIDR